MQFGVCPISSRGFRLVLSTHGLAFRVALRWNDRSDLIDHGIHPFDILYKPAATLPVCSLGVCLFLVFFASLIMYTDPLVDYRGRYTIMVGVSLMLPWFVMVSLLVRSNSWLALAASVLFVVALLSMLIFNACSSNGSRGFFFQMVT
jgi:hypothetical protein